MSERRIDAAALQFPVTMDVTRNVETLARLAAQAPRAALIVAPEGALSGYAPRADLTTHLDQAATERAIDHADALARSLGVHLVAGACVRDSGLWRNRAYYFGPRGERAHYDKINLAQSERSEFSAGDALPVFDVVVNDAPLRLGVQMCREIRYPEQWRVLAARGAHVIAYVNNAIGSMRGDALWRAHMISRAAETQRFVIGANNAAADQTCPSGIVSPAGEMLAEAPAGAEAIVCATLALDEVSDWVLSQARADIVRVTVRDGG